MTKRVLCKFFVKGECLKGDGCEFSHDFRDQANNVCTFYQRGACSFGSQCRNEHIQVSQPQILHSSLLANTSHDIFSDSVDVTHPFIITQSEERNPASDVVPASLSALSRPFDPPNSMKRIGESYPQGTSETEDSALAALPICAYAIGGNCPRGVLCPQPHGNLCSICEKFVLHPYRQGDREAHTKICESLKKSRELIKLSKEIECSVCLERVLSKPTAAEKKFGLLSECDHPFCISCIRSWRSNSPNSGMDVNTAVRACPLCRKLSYYVIPSGTWYSTQEEKQQIVQNYKAKLRSIDCKHFDFGNGSCPFGNSCFYKHTYRPDTHERRYHSYRSSSFYSDDEEELEDIVDEFTPDIYDWDDFMEQEELDNLEDEDEDEDGDVDDLVETLIMMQVLGLDGYFDAQED